MTCEGLGRSPGGEHLDPGGGVAQRLHHLQAQRDLGADPAPAAGARGAPVPAVAAYPDPRPEIQFIRPVAHVAHRPAGVHLQDGVAEAGVQAGDREPDPVRFGKRDSRGGAAVAPGPALMFQR